MPETDLRPKQKRRWRPTTTESNHARPVAENWHQSPLAFERTFGSSNN